MRITQSAMLLSISALLAAALLHSNDRLAAAADDNATKPTTLFIVRHAEKTGESGDAQLSSEGLKRAETLAWTLRDLKFDAVYSTDFDRTRDTVKAIAESSGKSLSYYGLDQKKFADKLRSDHAGHTILISGHSDTIPKLLAALGTPIKDKILPGYDALFVVTLLPDSATMHQLHYPGTH